MSETAVDVLLVGGGVMSATLGTLLNRLDPALRILMVEQLDDVALESSDGWNNAGTGHAGYCELHYTPQAADGSVPIARALRINAAFETSLQLWAALVEQGALPEPASFIRPVPHCSFVWGEADVAFLRARYTALSQHPLFGGMDYSEDAAVLRDWMPLVMEGRAADRPVAATRVIHGADVDFGALTRHLVVHLKRQPQFELWLRHTVQSLNRQRTGGWQVTLHDTAGGRSRRVLARFVFLGAGGNTLSLLQKSGIAEGRGYAGFPVSGQWLVCTNPEVIRRHHAKVYGKAPLGAPPMSVPHLDTRMIAGRPALLFGPYAGFTTRFLKRGSLFDLVGSVRGSNLRPMLAAGWHNTDLVRYLIGEALQSHAQRMIALRRYYPEARDDEWVLAEAGKRVQIIKSCGEKGGRLEFGTEIVAAADGSLAALLGASPGASVSAQAMLDVIARCFVGPLATPAWQSRLRTLVSVSGHALVDEPARVQEIRPRLLRVLGLG